jgi:hypothetical protein
MTICGVAAMTLLYEVHYSTMDIDADFAPKEDMLDIAEEISHELNLSNLKAKILDAESLPAMKVVSAREGTFDFEDPILLMGYLQVSDIYSFALTFPIQMSGLTRTEESGGSRARRKVGL